MKQSKNFYAGFSKNLEKPQGFVPLKSDYKRFVEEQEAKKPKRIPEIGAKLPLREKEETGVRKFEQRMRESLGEKPKPKPKPKPKQFSAEKKPVEIKKEKKTQYISGYEKAGKPSKLQVGSNVKSSDKQVESRKKMIERKGVGRKR